MTAQAATSDEASGVGTERTKRSNGLANAAEHKPMLLFFYSPTSGQSRRAEGFLAQVLQRRRNHDTFALRQIDCEAWPELTARFGIERLPALAVVEDKRLRAKIEQPRGCSQIQSLLAPWLK